MSHKRAQELSLRAATETRLGVARMADSVARQAALERACSGHPLSRDVGPALPDAGHGIAVNRASRTALEQREIERFRSVLGVGAREDVLSSRR